MVCWSSLARISPVRGVSTILLQTKNGFAPVVFQVRNNSHKRVFEINASYWTWNKFKDLTLYYILVATIPLGLLVAYCNVFIGPPKLAPIPEGYKPKEYEYYDHPISRWIVKYCWNDPQQDYEKWLHYLYENDEAQKLMDLDEKVYKVMKKNKDYMLFYYKPIPANYLRVEKEVVDELDENTAMHQK